MERAVIQNPLTLRSHYDQLFTDHTYQERKNKIIAIISVVAFVTLSALSLYFFPPSSVSNIYSLVGLLPIAIGPMYLKIKDFIIKSKNHQDMAHLAKKIIDEINQGKAPIDAYIAAARAECIAFTKIFNEKVTLPYIEFKKTKPAPHLSPLPIALYHHAKKDFESKLKPEKLRKEEMRDNFLNIQMRLAYLTYIKSNPADTQQFEDKCEWIRGFKKKGSLFIISKQLEISRKEFSQAEKDIGNTTFIETYSQKFALNPPQAV